MKGIAITVDLDEVQAGMAHQGENFGSAWDLAMQETLPTIRRMIDGEDQE